MITVKLQGGLGNQMFQYALGRTVSKRLGTKLALDISFYSKSLNRVFELNNFNIKAEIKRYGIVHRIIGKFSSSDQKIITEKSQLFDAEILKSEDGSTFSGYWQNEKYFSETRDEIQNELTLKKGLEQSAAVWEMKIKENESVSIHIRRGDYLQSKHINLFGILPIGYYINAVNLIAQKISKPAVFVFSDDIKWATENLKLPYPTEFVSDKNISAPEEMILMSRCKHNIIANSTFSWWGAWLNRNPDKIVIAPKNWFVTSNQSSDDIIPNTWLKI